jgi:hypothetical protein
MAVESAGWVFDRLREVGWREIPFRMRERWRRQSDRWTAGPWDGIPVRAIPRWPISSMFSLSPSERGDLAGDADALLHRGFRLLGVARTPAERADFTLDPTSGLRWPLHYAFDIPLRVPGRDVKVVWELSRLQHLQRLAVAAVVLGRRDAEVAVRSDLEAWLAIHPPFRGVAYASGVEVACRVVSLLVLLGWLGDGWPTPLRDQVVRVLGAHGAWLERYPSLYSSANNHRIAELGALAILGALAVDYPGAARWQTTGIEGLRKEIPRQIGPDGVGAEHSLAYQAWTMEWVLAVASVVGWELLGPELRGRMEAGGQFLNSMLDVAGNAPAIGDDDGTTVLFDRLDRDRYVGSIAGITASMLGRPQHVPRGWSLGVRARLLGVTEARVGKIQRARTYRGGYTVLRWGRGATERLVWFDHGPLGFPSLAAHGHADALAIGIHSGGTPVIVDAGTGTYADPDRAYFRGTAAHATVRVDQRDQSEPRGAFTWARRAQARRLDVRFDPDGGAVSGEHDGYLDCGVMHRRHLEFRGGRGSVFDRLEGTGEHLIEVLFPLAPGLQLSLDRGAWCVSDERGPLLSIVGPVDLVARVHRGGDASGLGWVSPRYGERVASFTLAFVAMVRLPWEGTTRFRFLDDERAMLSEES